jgi:hypothetical protein
MKKPIRLFIKNMVINNQHSVQVRAVDLFDDCLAEGRDGNWHNARDKAADELMQLRVAIDGAIRQLMNPPAEVAPTHTGDKVATKS